MEKKLLEEKKFLALEAPLMDRLNLAVKVTNVEKSYRMYNNSKEKLADLILPTGAGKEFKALKNISFEVEKGEIVGLLGLNGAGKSTLSNIIGGVSIPTSGEIEINGESAVIAVGLGLNNFLTGLENIELKATMMGYKRDDIDRITKEVIEFAEIGDFIKQPIRSYSSGMRARLGFGIAVNMSPDILVIDEALSVGDPTFTKKCLDKMNEFKKNGKTIFFVSHSTPQVREFCTKAIWLEYGSLREYGPIDEIIPKYENYIKGFNKMTEKEKKEYKLKVLKEQEHGLLKNYQYNTVNFHTLDSRGKFIKKIILSKDGKLKKVTYSIDYATIIFGFLPQLFRKDISFSLLILIAQVLNLFIMSWPAIIVTNFLITITFSFLAGKRKVRLLILNKNYEVEKYETLEIKAKEKKEEKLAIKLEKQQRLLEKKALKGNKKQIQVESEIAIDDKEFESSYNRNVENSKKRYSKNLAKKRRQNRKVALIIILLLIGGGGTYFFNEVNLEKRKKQELSKPIIKTEVEIPPVVKVDENIDLNKFTYILVKEQKDGTERIDSLATFKLNEDNSINLEVFPGNILVNGTENQELRELLDYKDEKSIKTIMKETFNYEVKDYIVVKVGREEKFNWSKNYYEDRLEKVKNNQSDERNNENIISKSFGEEDLENLIQKLKDTEEIIIEYVNYNQKTLKEYCAENEIDIPQKNKNKDYEFIYINEEIIKNSKVMKALEN